MPWVYVGLFRLAEFVFQTVVVVVFLNRFSREKKGEVNKEKRKQAAREQVV